MSSNKRKNIYSDRSRNLEDRWTKRTGKKKENWKEKQLQSFYVCLCCQIVTGDCLQHPKIIYTNRIKQLCFHVTDVITFSD